MTPAPRNVQKSGIIPQIINPKTVTQIKRVYWRGETTTACAICNDFITKNFSTINWLSIISDSADIKADVTIGSGSIIHDNVYINRGTSIGNHCIINNNSSIDHDCIWSDFSSCGPVVVTGGRIEIGYMSFIGMNSVVLQGIKVKENTVIGAKSLVDKNCESNSLYYGNSIKFIKKIPDDFNYFN